MRTADAPFVSLAQLLGSAAARSTPVPAAAPRARSLPDEPLESVAPEPWPVPGCTCAEPEDIVFARRSARLFRAAVAEAFDTALEGLVRALALEVLGRELRLAPADLAAIAHRLLAERRVDEPLRVRVAPADAALLCELPVVVDPSLEAGDAILECRSGVIDARLSLRLAGLLAAEPR